MEPIICSPSRSGQQTPIALTVAAKNEQPHRNTFIDGDSVAIDLPQLRDHRTPLLNNGVPLISHAEVVDIARETVHHIFRHEKIATPQIRVSHPVNEAAASDTLKLVHHQEDERTPDYHQWMTFTIELPSVSDTIGKDKVNMCIGGVSQMGDGVVLPSLGQKFQLFAGFMVRSSSNTCVFDGGLLFNLWVEDQQQLKQALYELLCEYDACEQLCQLERMLLYSIHEGQFAQLLGRAKLYELLASTRKAHLPEFLFTGHQVSNVAEGYLHAKEQGDDISLWQLYNLLLTANKSSNIDLFLPRAANASSFIGGLATALENKRNHWFIS
jgi:hypothetical protein